MASYVGSSLIVLWVQAAATTNLDTDFRSLTYTPEIELYDDSAGADVNHQYIVGRKNGRASFTGLMQSGNFGNYIGTLLVEGAVGTLKISPEGTAATKPLITMPAISMGGNFNMAYDNLFEFSCDFQQNGARTVGTN